jgi:hypothetical protein
VPKIGSRGATEARRQCRRGWIVIVGLVAIGVANAAAAQDATVAAPPQPREHPFANAMKVLAGGGAAFIEHEADHVLFDLFFDAR